MCFVYFVVDDLTAGLQVLLVGRDGQAIDAVVFFVATVACDSRVFDEMALELRIKSFPEFFVLDGNEFFAFLAFPAVRLPIRHLLGHALANVNAVGEYLHAAGTFKFGQSLDDGFKFHLVVGCLDHRARFFDLFARR